jgi:lipopolysaccharide export system protein LptA
MLSKSNRLSGDSLAFYSKSNYGIAQGNVHLLDTSEKVTLSVDYGKYMSKEGKSFITGSVMVSKQMDNDTLHITGDTIKMIEDTFTKIKNIFAYKNVKIFSRQFQGKCDSLTYQGKDSILYLNKKPVIWLTDLQAIADEIKFYIKTGKADKMDLLKRAFLLQKVDSNSISKFNQVKGRNMYGYFKQNKLTYLDVKGNTESVYYALDEKKQFIGVNKINASDAKVKVSDNKIKTVAFINSPDGKMMPVANQGDIQLDGLNNRFSEKPNSLEDIRPKRVVGVKPVKKPVSKKKVVVKKKVGKR